MWYYLCNLCRTVALRNMLAHMDKQMVPELFLKQKKIADKIQGGWIQSKE